MKTITVYVCDGCGAEYRSERNCKQHEKFCVLCPKCDHAYYVYGCELNCELENNGKRCSFKPKEQSK